MKYRPYQYAEALYEALEGKDDRGRAEALRHFSKVLQKNHDSRLLERIVVYYEKIFLKRRGLRKVDVEAAAPLSPAIRREIEAAAGDKVLLTEKVKPELLAGLTILLEDSVFIDASARTKINSLFSRK